MDALGLRDSKSRLVRREFPEQPLPSAVVEGLQQLELLSRPHLLEHRHGLILGQQPECQGLILSRQLAEQGGDLHRVEFHEGNARVGIALVV